MAELSVVDYEHFKNKIRVKTGLNLNAYKQEQMERRLRSFMERAGAQNFGQYYHMLEANEKMMKEFMDRVTINVSEMFRNPEQFVVLEKKVLPELLTRSSSLKVWSAGGSYGQEAHTLAICLEEVAPRKGHKILCSDIDVKAMESARKGAFSAADMRGVTEERKKRWFESRDGVFEADKHLREMIEVKPLDLLEDAFPKGFDLIVCRNVVIYFTEETKDRLYRRFFESLKPGGFLFVGGTERVNGADNMGYQNPYPFFYQKPLK